MNNEWALLDTLQVEMSVKEKEARQRHLQQQQVQLVHIVLILHPLVPCIATSWCSQCRSWKGGITYKIMNCGALEVLVLTSIK